MAASGVVGVRAGHGDPSQSTTMSCYLCHNSTISGAGTSKRNKYSANNACSTCHTAADSGEAVYITNLSSHVNGAINVNFASQVVRSKAQLRQSSFITYTSNAAGWYRTGTYKTGTPSSDYAKNNLNTGTFNAGNCSNMACHPTSYVTPVNWATDNGKASACVMCHSKL